MKFPRKITLKTLLFISLAINVLLVGYIAFLGIVSYVVDKNDSLFYAELNSLQQYYCGEGYDKAMRDIDSRGDDEVTTATQKHVYAMTVCLKNYKTGEDLDLSPLTDQVNKTPPLTSIDR